MLRVALVYICVLIGACLALRGPFYGLLFYLWNAYFDPASWVWNREYVDVLRLSYLLGAYVVVLTFFSRSTFPINRRTALLGLFLGHCALTALISPHSVHAWQSFEQFFRIIVITYAMITLVDTTKRLELALVVICLSLGLEAAKQGWIHSLLHPTTPNTNRIRFLGDNNGVAVGALMLAPVLLSLVPTTKSRALKRFYQFLAGGVVLRALSTWSRGGFLSCAAMASVYWVKSQKRVRVALTMVVLALAAAPLLPDAFWERMHSIGEYEEDKSAVGRLHFWNVAFDMAKDNPIFGVGFSSYERAYDQYDHSEGQFGERRAVHSAWFGALSELGFAGFALYALTLVLALRACRRAHLRARAAPDDEELARLARYGTAIGTSLWTFAVGGSFTALQYNEMMWHFVGLSIVVDLLSQRASERRESAAAAADSDSVRLEHAKELAPV